MNPNPISPTGPNHKMSPIFGEFLLLVALGVGIFIGVGFERQRQSRDIQRALLACMDLSRCKLEGVAIQSETEKEFEKLRHEYEITKTTGHEGLEKAQVEMSKLAKEKAALLK